MSWGIFMFGVMHIQYTKKQISLFFVFLVVAFGPSSFWAQTLPEVVEVLSNLPGASGFEKPVRDFVLGQLEPLNGVSKIDGMGNLLFTFGAKNPKNKTVLFMAHLDEVGFITTEIDNEGFIKAQNLGGWLSHVIWSQRWLIQTPKGSIPAISGIDPPHVLSNFDKPPALTRAQFFLDTGLDKTELVRQGFRPGLSVVPDVKFKKIGRFYSGKAFDDRLGVASLLQVAKILSKEKRLQSNVNLAFAFTTQEELGMRGSKVVASSLAPDIVFNIDAGVAHDYPVQFAKNKGPKLGGGPSLFVFDGSMVPNQTLLTLLVSVAKANHIPFQWESEVSYGEDGSSVQQTGGGSATVNIGIPIRYIHSHLSLFQFKYLFCITIRYIATKTGIKGI